MTARIQDGQWVRWIAADSPHPLARWRRLDAIVVASPGFPELVFADGYRTPWPADDLALVGEDGRPQWEVSTTRPDGLVDPTGNDIPLHRDEEIS